MTQLPEESSRTIQLVFSRSVLAMGLLWLSFPPVGLSVLAWVSLIPLLHLTASTEPLSRWNYVQIYFAGIAYWLATFYFIPIPHPALWLGWFVISAYLGCYLPIFVSTVRTLHGRFRIPFVISAAICWTGLELIRNYLFTGMGLVSLAHSQFRHPMLLQICDLSGGYTLTFAIVIVAASGFMFVNFAASRPWVAVCNALAGAVVLTGIFVYGNAKIRESNALANHSLLVGLIQGNMDTNLMSSPEEYKAFLAEKSEQYQQLNYRAISQWEKVDLVVWPENGWPYPDMHPDTDKSNLDSREIEQYEYAFYDAYAKLFVTGKTTPNFLVGALTYDPAKSDSYGSALFIDNQGKITHRYYKNHLVMFGEYVPLADWFPLLRRIPAVGKGLVAGTKSEAIDVQHGFKVTPSICFESTVPHFIRNQINSLAQADNEPDAMINLTNDGWFYGTSCLDFHLACNVFRAVEMRKPHLVCANTGLSAHIDEKGRIIKEGPRRETAYILAEVQKTDAKSTYRQIGDSIPITFAAITLVAFLFSLIPSHQPPIKSD